jgi:hypothetical protein
LSATDSKFVYFFALLATQFGLLMFIIVSNINSTSFIIAIVIGQ